jgi:hypothetical protein
MFGSGRCPFWLGSLVPNGSPMRRTIICLLKDCLKVKSELKAAFYVDCSQRFNNPESWMSENSPAGGTVFRYGMISPFGPLIGGLDSI